MWHQFLSIWQDTFVAGYSVGVLMMAFQIGGLLAFGLTKHLATRTLVYRDELILIPVWTVGISCGYIYLPGNIHVGSN